MTGEITIPRTAPLKNCPICASQNTKHFFTSPDRLHGTPGEFSYHLCDSCETVFQNPMVIQEDLHLCYPETYYTHTNNDSTHHTNSSDLEEYLQKLPNNFQKELRLSVISAVKGETVSGFTGSLGKLLSKSKNIRERAFLGYVMDEMLPDFQGTKPALEIGCGAGDLLKDLQRVGWRVEGVEWDEKAAEAARKKNNCSITVGDVRSLNLQSEKYGLIVLKHVFEHFSNPVEVLTKLKQLLAPHGRIVLIYPNPKSFGIKYFKTNWYHWDPPRHLTFLPVKQLKKQAEKLNLTVKYRTSSEFSNYVSSFSRSYQNNKQFNAADPKLDRWDTLFKFTEEILIKLGFNVGDEVIMVLEKQEQ